MSTVFKPSAALIGCGNIGRWHARALAISEYFDLVAAADLFPQALEELRKIVPTVRTYADTDEMLAREKPHLAIVATTAKDHCAPTLAALRAGAHVLCEKPMAMTLAEADRMIACATEMNRRLLINNEYNVNPRTLAAARLVRDGQIGDMVQMRCSFKGNFCGGWDLVEGGCHLFSLCMQFAGEPRWVSAQITTNNRPATVADIFDSKALKAIPTGYIVGDRVQALVGFDNGVVLHAEFLGVKTSAFVEVIGTQGRVLIPMGMSADTTQLCRKPYANPNDPAAQWEPVAADWGRLEAIPDLMTRALAAGYNATGEWLKTGGQHPMDAGFARWSLEIIHGVFESHFQNGGRIALPLAQRDHPLERRLEKQPA